MAKRTPPPDEDEGILVSYRGPSSSLTVDDVVYPVGEVLPMSKSRYLDVCANEELRAEGHSLAVHELVAGGVIEEADAFHIDESQPPLDVFPVSSPTDVTCSEPESEVEPETE